MRFVTYSVGHTALQAYHAFQVGAVARDIVGTSRLRLHLGHNRLDGREFSWPASTSWTSSISRAVSGALSPASAPSVMIGPSCGSASVRRLRTARSRQMPLCVLADLRLNAIISSIERSETARGTPGINACGS